MNLQQLYRRFRDSKGVSTDSRKIRAGQIFFALKGPNFNGNTYAEAALEKGALLAVVDDPDQVKNSQYLLVDHGLEALQQLANFHRRQVAIKALLGITGSNGKTTTKELVSSVLSAKYKVSTTAENFNNHIGVPLSLLKIKDDHDLAIIEMGASNPGDISELCKIAQPDHGIITNIGRAHLEGMGGLEGVKKTKSALYKHVINRKGTLIIDNQETSLIDITPNYEKIFAPTLDIAVMANEPFLLLEYQDTGRLYKIQTQLTGVYNIQNIRYALLAAHYFKIPIEDAIEAIQNYQPKNMRSQIMRMGNSEIILDAYNSNPDSLKNSLDNLLGSSDENKAAFLGDMLELGKDSRRFHQEVIDRLNSSDVQVVVLVGEEFGKCNIPDKFLHFDSVSEAKKDFDQIVRMDFKILIKGSHSIGMEKLLIPS